METNNFIEYIFEFLSLKQMPTAPSPKGNAVEDWEYIVTHYLLDVISYYSIHVPGWLRLLKWLNLISADGSVSNEPGSVTWLATKYLKTVSWRNHTEKLTTLWLQNISFWPKIFRFHYFNAKLLGKYSQTPVWQLCDSCQILDLINFQNNLTWPNSNTSGNSVDCRLKYSKNTHRYAKDSPFTCFLYWKIPIDTDFIGWICQVHLGFGLSASAQVPYKPALAWVACPGILHRS